MRLVIILLSVFVFQALAATPTVPMCPLNLVPTTEIMDFEAFATTQGKRCSGLCSAGCVGSVKLLSAQARCLIITVNTTASLSDFPNVGGICINISSGIMVTSDIEFRKGDNCVFIGKTAIVGDIKGGRGNDFVYANDSSTVGKIDLGDGNDVLETGYSVTISGVNTGSGSDVVEVYGKTGKVSSLGTVDLGKGSDFLHSSFGAFSSINAGSGSDIVSLNQSTVQKTLNLGSSDDFAYFNGSTVTNLNGGSGENVFAYNPINAFSVGGLDSDSSSDILCSYVAGP